MNRWLVLVGFLLAACGSGGAQHAPPKASPEGDVSPKDLLFPGEKRIKNVRQLTAGGENAEAYWSPDGRLLVFQSTRAPYECDQIYTMKADGSDVKLVSSGKGRTTCAYFLPDASRILYSSTHLGGPECPPKPDHSRGYVWPVYPTYEIFTCKPDGSDLQRMTNSEGYDAEATVCWATKRIVFTSSRDGDLELYSMNVDGGDVKRLTNHPGYDGGAFFSMDGKRIVWRAQTTDTPEKKKDVADLLARGLVRPTQLEIMVADADGSNARALTKNGAANFAPYFHPDGKRVLFASNVENPRGRNFDLYLVNDDGTGLERVTFNPTFDGFPMFSPDGKKLVFASNRNEKKPGETNLFVADWVE
jgi:Tol biopolymer transport system component